MKSVRWLIGTLAVGTLALSLAQVARADDFIIGDDIFVLSGRSIAGLHLLYPAGAKNDTSWATTYVDYGKYSGGAFTSEDISAIQNPQSPYAVNVDKVNSYGSFNNTPYSYADPFAFSSWISVAADPGPNVPGTPPVGTFQNEPVRLGNKYPDTFAYTTIFNVDKDGYYILDGKFLSDDILQDAAVNYNFQTGARDADLSTTTPADTYRTPGTLSGGFYLHKGDNALTFFVLDNGNDRTALDYSTKLTMVPEPGAVAFGTVLMGGLLGLMGRARLRSRRSL
jgi:hypothetical protein